MKYNLSEVAQNINDIIYDNNPNVSENYRIDISYISNGWCEGLYLNDIQIYFSEDNTEFLDSEGNEFTQEVFQNMIINRIKKILLDVIVALS